MKSLNARREFLIAQANLQRQDVAHYIQQLHQPILIADCGIKLFRFVRKDPYLLFRNGLALRYAFLRLIGQYLKIKLIWAALRKLKSILQN